MRCKVCNAYIPEGAIHCLECGNEIDEAIVCQICGARMGLDARFCNRCGSNVKKPAKARIPDHLTDIVHGKVGRKCFRCGNQVPDETQYCPTCGTSVGGDVTESVPADPVESTDEQGIDHAEPVPGAESCPRCGTEVRGTGRFCFNCGRFHGSDIEDVLCASCGASNTLRYARCQYCGKDLPSRSGSTK
jgi:ribosomal protein L40E